MILNTSFILTQCKFCSKVAVSQCAGQDRNGRVIRAAEVTCPYCLQRQAYPKLIDINRMVENRGHKQNGLYPIAITILAALGYIGVSALIPFHFPSIVPISYLCILFAAAVAIGDV